MEMTLETFLFRIRACKSLCRAAEPHGNIYRSFGIGDQSHLDGVFSSKFFVPSNLTNNIIAKVSISA